MMERPSFFPLALLVTCLVASVGSQQQQQQQQQQPEFAAGVDPDVEFVFNPDVYDGYQRRFTVDVPAKKEECFFVENVRPGHKLHFHFMVVNVGKNGQKLDISAKIKSPESKIINFQSRKSEGKMIGEEISIPGDYEFCFNNRYSMFESKKVFWEVEVEGAEDESRQEQMEADASIEEFKENAKIIKKSVAQVRTKVSRMKHQQWRMEQNMKRDGARADALQDMVDRWSVIHVFIVVGVGIVQVIVLRRFFSVKTGPHRIHVRA